MRLKKSLVNIGEVPYTIIQFNYTPQKDKMLSKDNFKWEENTLIGIIEVNCTGKSILYLSRKNSKLVDDNLRVDLLSKTFNKFYIISSCHEDFQFKINEQVFYSSMINSKLTDKDIENLLYTLIYEEYYKGNSDKALDILINSLKDKYLVKLVTNSFTAKERQRCADILLRAAHNRKMKLQKRLWVKARFMEGQIEDNEIIDDPPCLIELLEKFSTNGDKFIPVPSENYKRIGKRVVDNYNSFKRDKSVKVVADFKNLVFTKEKLNISIRYEIPGYVTINPRQARAVGFETNSFKAKIYREQTIIKDGDINIDKFQALVSKETLNYLEGLVIKDLFTIVEKKDNSLVEYTLILMNISKIPVLNKSYVLKSDSLDYLLDTCFEQRAAECKQKVIKFFIEKQGEDIKFKDKKYSKEQIELLESYGLDSKGVYSGIDNKVIQEVSDQYECRFFEFGLKGFSNLPKVEALLTKLNKGEKKLNAPEAIMKNYIQYLKENHLEASFEQLNKLLEEQRVIIKNSTRILAQIKLAKAVTGGWWQGLKLDSKGNYLYVRGDKTLIIKAVRKTIQI
jgi:hypothetical protein